MLASPTVFASDLASTLAMCLGIGIPSTVLRRARPFSAIPPTTPAAAAPTAMAGPFALPATCLTEPTMPLPFWLPLLPLARAGAEERLDAALPFARPLADFGLARAFARGAFARAFDEDFARPFEDADRFVPPDPLAARDVVALAGFARLLAALDRLVVALVPFAAEPFALLSATVLPSRELSSGRYPEPRRRSLLACKRTGPIPLGGTGGEQETMLRNARAEFADEAHDIATYTVIDSLATAVGDRTTATLARATSGATRADAEVPPGPAAGAVPAPRGAPAVLAQARIGTRNARAPDGCRALGHSGGGTRTHTCSAV